MQTLKRVKAAKKGKPDLTLVLSRLEDSIIRGDDPAGCRLILAKERLWETAGADIQLKLARLAQMAGETEGALKILTFVNQTKPALTEAWTERLELLTILGRKEELAQVLAISKDFIGDDSYRTWIKMLNEYSSSDSDPDIDVVVTPFEVIHRR